MTSSVANTAPQRATNAYALAALAFGVVGAVVLSVICAVAALCEIENRDEGRGLAVAGLLVSAGWIVVLSMLAGAHAI
ncbi:hypothetical protein [Mycobacterium lacus]|uniref:Uncharacterized protein n=1 Tax=Mycobacterium lacus TaxID=169765 RepID=A0A1X1Y3L0_9MYCO|nr:hypothetical protein [Mycobacterium lacus]MCV7125365.1 hypothetical protein [Mycobacterium lacus]ORW05713.1 hypothetical protein AWC15_01440 [Mycobacterium lacus]BBX99316.1 hypothetical protein MLAC_46100 [Mycobacterium lacus]